MTDKQMIAILSMIKKIVVKCETKEEVANEIDDIISEVKNTNKGND
ncbi:MAG: hypothetical protein FWF44_07975 [Defluviitaleaceae bacterium]|nr:hypothetical protein [Defluviitaleaceae bacterium]